MKAFLVLVAIGLAWAFISNAGHRTPSTAISNAPAPTPFPTATSFDKAYFSDWIKTGQPSPERYLIPTSVTELQTKPQVIETNGNAYQLTYESPDPNFDAPTTVDYYITGGAPGYGRADVANYAAETTPGWTIKSFSRDATMITLVTLSDHGPGGVDDGEHTCMVNVGADKHGLGLNSLATRDDGDCALATKTAQNIVMYLLQHV